METPKQSSNARLAAIFALAAAFLILLVIVVASLTGEESSDRSAPQSRTRQGRAEDRQQQRKVYVVKPSDCCLSEIAEKTGIELEALQELNPGLDPQAIHSGDRVKLR